MREMSIEAIFMIEPIIIGRCVVSLLGYGPSLALPLDAEIVFWDTLLHLRKLL